MKTRAIRWRLLGLGLAWLAGIGVLTACAGSDEAPLAPPSSGTTTFTSVAAQVGLNFQQGAFRWGLSGDPVAMMGGGLCWLDYDQDGWLDLFVVNSYAEAEAGQWETQTGGLPRSALFHNNQGRFEDVSQASGADVATRGNGCVAADFDKDGWTDLYITTARFGLLLWNQGDGTFHEGAEAAGVGGFGWHTGAAVGDVDGDGWPDLFVAGYVDLNQRLPEATLGFPNTFAARPDQLFLNNGPGPQGQVTFREVGRAAGLESEGNEYGLGATLSDMDGDGRLDLYVANDTNPNRLYLNEAYPGGKAADPLGLGFRLAEAGGPAGVDDPNSGMGVATGDYDGDGRPDLFVTNLGTQLNGAFRNASQAGQLRFEDVRQQIGNGGPGAPWTGWGVIWADFDLDTDLDLMIVNGNVPVQDLAADAELVQYYQNLTAQGQSGKFEDAGAAVGLEQVGPIVGRGAAAADFDNDGDLDVAINSIGGPLTLLRNDRQGGNWLSVALAGFQPGAVVTATLPDGRQLERTIQAGGSYLSSEDPRALFGLDDAGSVAEVRVRWPDGRETRLQRVGANRVVGVGR